MRIPARARLIFDLDGTLSDPLTGIARCVNYALRCHGLDAAKLPDVAALIGVPLDDTFRSLIAEHDDTPIEQLVTRYRARYARIGYAENVIYQGIGVALERLSGSGVGLGICTSKRVDFAEKILELFEIRTLFSFVDGGDVGIDKAQQLCRLLSAGLIDAGSVMIGDRAVDIRAAKANGLASVGVLWGYGTLAELEEAGAEKILERPSELLQLAEPTQSWILTSGD